MNKLCNKTRWILKNFTLKPMQKWEPHHDKQTGRPPCCSIVQGTKPILLSCTSRSFTIVQKPIKNVVRALPPLSKALVVVFTLQFIMAKFIFPLPFYELIIKSARLLLLRHGKISISQPFFRRSKREENGEMFIREMQTLNCFLTRFRYQNWEIFSFVMVLQGTLLVFIAAVFRENFIKWQ